MGRLGLAFADAARRRDTIAAGVALVALTAAAFDHARPIVAAVSTVAASTLAALLFKLGKVEAQAHDLVGQCNTSRLPEALAEAALRLEATLARDGQIHPITGVATREPLACHIASDIAADVGEGLLGVVRFADFDRLAAFDLESANDALARFAKRLTSAANSNIAVGQIDRDIFALWLRAPPAGRATAEFQSLVYVARQELETLGGAITPKVDAATVSYPHDGIDAPHLFARAIAALNSSHARASTAGLIDTPLPTSEARDRYRLEQDLSHAIDDGQLTMMFQPVVDLTKGRLIGAEALLRWDHPELGAVSPAHFIPVVEESGLADRFGLFVLNAACREAHFWRDAGLLDLKVAVNLSARQLNDPSLKEKVERTLARHRLQPAALELELTETAAMSGAEGTFALFSALRQTGISLAIDDFGSGYSSLSYLKNLPFDKLKIDREFVTDIDRRRDSRAICRALIELGRGLGLLVLAEGVETAAEVETLRALGCDIFQGFFFSKPLSGGDFRRLAADPNWLADRAGAKPTLQQVS